MKNLFITLYFFFGFSLYAHADLGDNLIHSYDFESSSIDLVSTADLTLLSGATFTAYGKKFGSEAIDLNASGRMAYNFTYNFTAFDGDFTINLWSRQYAIGGGGYVFSVNDSSYNNYWAAVTRNNDGTYSVNMYDGPSNGNNNPSFNTSCAITDTTDTHMLTFRRANNGGFPTIEFYVDGGICGYITDTTSGNVVNVDDFRIGNSIASTNNYTASVDDFDIWNRALSGTEISDLWNTGNGVDCPTNCNVSPVSTSTDVGFSFSGVGTGNLFSLGSSTISFGAVDLTSCDLTSINVNPFASSSLSFGTFNIPNCSLQLLKFLLFGTNGFDTYNITNFINSSSSTLPFLTFKFMAGSLIYINPANGKLVNLPQNATTSLTFSIPLFGTSSAQAFNIPIMASSTFLSGMTVPPLLDKTLATLEFVFFALMWAIIFKNINI